MADKAHRLTDEKLEEMEKRLSAIYSRAEKEIQKTADEYFSRFAKQDEAKRKLLEQGKLTEDEYTKWRKGKVMYGKRFTEMKEQYAQQLLNVNQTALAYVNGELPEVYALNYNALASSVDGVGGYSFTLVDTDTVRNLAVTDTSLLPYKEIDPTKDIPWNMKKINAETLQGILQGESMDKIAKRLRNVQEMNKTQAIRSARTLVTGAENKGRLDSHKRAEEDGIILEEKWVATKDGRTRHSHAMLNGETKKTNKTFSNGLEYPGDPSGRPEEVYNCRCTMTAKVLGFKKLQVQKAMAEKQEETPQGFTPASSTKELNQRLSTATGTSADFSAMDLKLANEYLEGFESFYDEYPALRGFVGRVDTKVPKRLTGAYDRKTTYTRDYRHSVSNSVSLTSQYSESDFHRILDGSIKKGFHFEGMTPQGLARHECTHALDDLIGNTRKGYVKNGKFVSLDGTISANAYNQSVASEILDAVRSERYDEWLTGYFDDVRYLGDYAMTSDKEMLAQCIAYETSGRTHPFSAAVKKRFDELYKEVLG